MVTPKIRYVVDDGRRTLIVGYSAFHRNVQVEDIFQIDLEHIIENRSVVSPEVARSLAAALTAAASAAEGKPPKEHEREDGR